MSAWIGCAFADNSRNIEVWASRAGVETGRTDLETLSPRAARNLAALLVRAADECERMRAPSDDRVLNLDALLRAVRDAETHQFDAGSCIRVVEAAKAVARSK
jgi:hypothetical protein